jgi:hypothetical protein
MVLAVVFITTGIGYAAPANQSEAVADAKNKAYQEEFAGAISRGLVIKELEGSYDATITHRQFVSLISNMLKKHDPKLFPKWKAVSEKAAVSNKAMLREDGMLALYLAAEVMGIAGEFNCNWGSTNDQLGDAQWGQFTFNYPLYPSWQKPRTLGGLKLNDAMAAAYFFSFGRQSMSDFKTVFEPDVKKRSMRVRDKFTRAEAIRAVVRLYDSVPKFAPFDAAGKNTVSQQSKKAALAMSKVKDGKLPNWHGCAFEFGVQPGIDANRYFIENDFAQIAKMGFNYVRIHYSYKHFADEKLTRVDLHVLENLDRVVEWGAKYGVHINIVLYELPGSRDDIESNKTHFNEAVKFWGMLAKRYADIPANVLSYNLLNEPGIGIHTSEGYGRLANSLIAEIRKYDREKLLLSDGVLLGDWYNWEGACTSMPSSYLKNDIAQSIHFYPWNMVRKSAHINLMQWPYEHRDTVNNMITSGKEPMTLQGDFDKDTEISLYVNNINNANAGMSLVLQADGKEAGRYVLDGIKKGKNNCSDLYPRKETLEYVADFGNNGLYNGWKLDFKLKEKAKELKVFLETKVDGTVAFREIFIKMPAASKNTYAVPDNTKVPQGFTYETGHFKTAYIYCSEVYSETASTVTIAADGTYTSTPEFPGHDSFDYETMREYFKKWKDWSIETGTPIICNEFAPISALPRTQRLAFLKATMDLLDELDIPWAITVSNMESWGPFILERDVRDGKAVLPCDGSYVKSGDMYIDQPALDLLRQYMSK